jgi:hypothetical protein
MLISMIREMKASVVFVSAWAIGCVAPPTADNVALSTAELHEKLQRIIVLGGPNSPQLSELYRQYDVTPILISMALSTDLNWYRRLTGEEVASIEDIEKIRRAICDVIFSIFDRFRDEKGYMFQIEYYMDSSIPYTVRMTALGHFWNANLVDVQRLFIRILNDHVSRKLYSADGLLVIGYIRDSIHLRPNHLWSAEMKKAVEDYLVFLKSYEKYNPQENNRPDPEVIMKTRQAIAELENNK